MEDSVSSLWNIIPKIKYRLNYIESLSTMLPHHLDFNVESSDRSSFVLLTDCFILRTTLLSSPVLAIATVLTEYSHIEYIPSGDPPTLQE